MIDNLRKKISNILFLLTKKVFKKKTQINFQLKFESVKNATMYFRKFQKVITQFMTHYDILRKNYKILKKYSNDLFK